LYVTPQLSALGQDDPLAASPLLPLGYDELRKLAPQWMAREQLGQTLQPPCSPAPAFSGTAIVRSRWSSRARWRRT
jgi:hypothetical protein